MYVPATGAVQASGPPVIPHSEVPSGLTTSTAGFSPAVVACQLTRTRSPAAAEKRWHSQSPATVSDAEACPP